MSLARCETGLSPPVKYLIDRSKEKTGLCPPVKYFYLPFQGDTSFVDHMCNLCLVFVMFSRLFIAALWPPKGKRADLVALVCDAYCD